MSLIGSESAVDFLPRLRAIPTFLRQSCARCWCLSPRYHICLCVTLSSSFSHSFVDYLYIIYHHLGYVG